MGILIDKFDVRCRRRQRRAVRRDQRPAFGAPKVWWGRRAEILPRRQHRHTRKHALRPRRGDAILTRALHAREFLADLLLVTAARPMRNWALHDPRATESDWVVEQGGAGALARRPTLSLGRTNRFFSAGTGDAEFALLSPPRKIGGEIVYDAEVTGRRSRTGCSRRGPEATIDGATEIRRSAWSAAPCGVEATSNG